MVIDTTVPQNHFYILFIAFVEDIFISDFCFRNVTLHITFNEPNKINNLYRD